MKGQRERREVEGERVGPTVSDREMQLSFSLNDFPINCREREREKDGKERRETG